MLCSTPEVAAKLTSGRIPTSAKSKVEMPTDKPKLYRPCPISSSISSPISPPYPISTLSPRGSPRPAKWHVIPSSIPSASCIFPVSASRRPGSSRRFIQYQYINMQSSASANMAINSIQTRRFQLKKRLPRRWISKREQVR